MIYVYLILCFPVILHACLRVGFSLSGSAFKKKGFLKKLPLVANLRKVGGRVHTATLLSNPHPMAGRVEIPLVLWNGPPPHSVTCMSLALDDTRLLTGSASGHICLWRLSLPNRSRSSSSSSFPTADPASGMEPWALLMGHASTVVDIGVGLYQGTEEVAISLSDDGTLCLWAPRDGRCLAKCPNLIRGIASPRAITVFRRSHYAAITGHDTGIEIINLWTLQSMRTMNAHQGEWVCATAVWAQ